MSGSSTNVNYTVRPCKSIERQMMCEIVSRLSSFDSISNYRYIGMGAKYFVDFILFHKRFNITEMYSMEISADENNKKRFQFNKPFNCINLLFGKAYDILNSSSFRWKNKRNIIWLDYDGGITGKQLQDIELCSGKVESGSIIFVSFNSDLGEHFNRGSLEEKMDILSERIDNENLLIKLSPKDIAGKNMPATINGWFNQVIRSRLLQLNATLMQEEQKMNFKQIAFFKYADSKATMYTIGWVFYNNSEKGNYTNCNFDELEFYNDSKVPYDISVPNFTYKELAVLNQNMPDGEYPISEAEFISKTDIDKYRKIYKYYPTTIETSITL